MIKEGGLLEIKGWKIESKKDAMMGTAVST